MGCPVSSYAPANAPSALCHGASAFVAQLMEALQDEQASALRMPRDPARAHSSIEDACQAITELAVQGKAFITADEFRSFNYFIGEAITDAVKAFVAERETVSLDQGMQIHRRLGEFADEQRRLLDVALHSAATIQTGGIARSEAIASALMSTLEQLRDHIERSVPDIRLMTGVTATPRHTAG